MSHFGRLRYQLHRLGFRVLLLDEYRTSSSRPDGQGNTRKTNIKRVNPRPWQRQLRPETFMACWSVKVHGARRSVVDRLKNGIGTCWLYAISGESGMPIYRADNVRTI